MEHTPEKYYTQSSIVLSGTSGRVLELRHKSTQVRLGWVGTVDTRVDGVIQVGAVLKKVIQCSKGNVSVEYTLQNIFCRLPNSEFLLNKDFRQDTFRTAEPVSIQEPFEGCVGRQAGRQEGSQVGQSLGRCLDLWVGKYCEYKRVGRWVRSYFIGSVDRMNEFGHFTKLGRLALTPWIHVLHASFTWIFMMQSEGKPCTPVLVFEPTSNTDISQNVLRLNQTRQRPLHF